MLSFRRPETLIYLTCSGVRSTLRVLVTLLRVVVWISRLLVCCSPRVRKARPVPPAIALSSVCPCFCRGTCIRIWCLDPLAS